MLKRFGFRKLAVTTTALFVIGLLYFFPTKELNVNKNITYYEESDFSEVFLLDKNNFVSEVSVISNGTDLIEKLKNKMELLIKKDNNEKIPSSFKGVIPSDTKVLSLSVENNICTIDFSKEILNVTNLMEEKMVEAIIYTLTSESEVKEVILKVEGKVLERLPNSNKLLPNVFDRSYGINKNYDINNLYDLTKTTVYYIGEDSGNSYYVPVTKVTNSNDDKISVIVSELKSSILYQSNLSSYLNSKAELINYEKEENVMKLTFNDKIFYSMYDKNILEEVVYTIGKSVKDNYNVDEVMFYVGDEMITKY